MSDVPSTVPDLYEARLEAGRAVGGFVLAGMRGGEEWPALQALAEGLNGWRLADAAVLLIADLLRTLAIELDEDPYRLAQKWALAMAERQTGS